jgi:hypothetical protein
MRSCRSLAHRSVGIAVLVASVLQGAAAQPGDNLPVMLKGQDRLECVLPNGGRFLLVSDFDYWPVPTPLVPHPPNMRENQSPWRASYKTRGHRSSPVLVEEDMGSRGPLRESYVREDMCAAFQLIRGNVVSPSKILFPGQSEFTHLSLELLVFPETKSLEMTSSERIKFEAIFDKGTTPARLESRKYWYSLQVQKLRSIGVDGERYRHATGVVRLARLEDALVKETMFVSSGADCESAGACPATAVWQARSTDGGRTWSPTEFKTTSELFVLGKSARDQPGIAKPGRYKVGPKGGIYD